MIVLTFIIGAIIGAADAVLIYKYGITGEYPKAPLNHFTLIVIYVLAGLTIIPALILIPGNTWSDVSNGLIAHSILLVIAQGIHWYRHIRR